MVVHYPRAVRNNSHAEHEVTGKTYNLKQNLVVGSYNVCTVLYFPRPAQTIPAPPEVGWEIPIKIHKDHFQVIRQETCASQKIILGRPPKKTPGLDVKWRRVPAVPNTPLMRRRAGNSSKW